MPSPPSTGRINAGARKPPHPRRRYSAGAGHLVRRSVAPQRNPSQYLGLALVAQLGGHVGVLMKPGAITFAVMGATAELARDRSRQADETGLAGPRSLPGPANRSSATTDDTKIIRPRRSLSIGPAARLATRYAPVRLVSTDGLERRPRSSEAATVSFVMPALDTSTSTGPCSASTAAERGVDLRPHRVTSQRTP